MVAEYRPTRTTVFAPHEPVLASHAAVFTIPGSAARDRRSGIDLPARPVSTPSNNESATGALHGNGSFRVPYR